MIYAQARINSVRTRAEDLSRSYKTDSLLKQARERVGVNIPA